MWFHATVLWTNRIRNTIKHSFIQLKQQYGSVKRSLWSVAVVRSPSEPQIHSVHCRSCLFRNQIKASSTDSLLHIYKEGICSHFVVVSDLQREPQISYQRRITVTMPEKHKRCCGFDIERSPWSVANCVTLWICCVFLAQHLFLLSLNPQIKLTTVDFRRLAQMCF